MPQYIFIAQLAATWTMFGVIWFVQIVHYPLFGGVGAAKFPAYEKHHSRLTSFVVAPPMLVELVSSAAALRSEWRIPSMPAAWAWLGFSLVVLIWLSTALVQVPRHTRLERGLDPSVHRSLVATNWIRTIAWTVRAALLAAVALRGLSQ